MNLFTLIAAGLRQRPLIQLLNLLGLALGVSLVVALVVSAGQLRQAATAEARGVDLVVGATGSPLQLVLSTVYHADTPTGNIAAEQWMRWRAHPLTAQVVPLSMGDYVSGYRLVGTTADLMDFFDLQLTDGAWWEETETVVVGAHVARDLGLRVGDNVVATHGSDDPGADAHDDHPLRVRGILAPTGRIIDRLVLTDLRTYWHLHGTGHGAADAAPDMTHAGQTAGSASQEDRHDGHGRGEGHDHDHDHEAERRHNHDHDHGHDHDEEEHQHRDASEHAHDATDGHGHDHDHDHHHHGPKPAPRRFSHEELEREQVTALLIRYASPMAAGRLAREINAQPRLQAAAPAEEMARLLAVFGALLLAAQGLAVLVLAVAAIGLFVALYQALEQRRYDIALLRALGASRRRVSLLLLGEAFCVATGAAALGWLLGHLGVEVMAQLAAGAAPLPITGWVWEAQALWVFPLAWTVALLAAAIPAWRAYRMAVSDVLAEHA